MPGRGPAACRGKLTTFSCRKTSRHQLSFLALASNPENIAVNIEKSAEIQNPHPGSNLPSPAPIAPAQISGLTAESYLFVSFPKNKPESCLVLSCHLNFTKNHKIKNMKKLTVLLAFSLLLFATSTYARTTDPTVPESINTEFSRDFSQAKDVKWEMGDKFFKATFDFRGKVLFAFYTDNADFMGIATNLRSDRLPHNLSSEIKTTYANYWITDLFRYRTDNEDGFTITLENSEKVIILKSVGDQGWDVYHVTNK
jgi:hypothetical protein